MLFKNWKDFLWPLGGTLLGLLVMPIAIAQYPRFFGENVWSLPVSVLAVVLCWIVPLLLHDRTRRIYSFVIAAVPRYGRMLFACVCLAVIVLFILGGMKLFRIHSRHLEESIAASKEPPVPAPNLNSCPDTRVPCLNGRVQWLTAAPTGKANRDSLLTMSLYITNTGAPTVVNTFSVKLITETGVTVTAEPYNPPRFLQLAISDGGKINLPYADYLPFKLASQQVPTNGGSGGFLTTLVRNVTRGQIFDGKTKLQVSFDDVTGKSYLVSGFVRRGEYLDMQRLKKEEGGSIRELPLKMRP